VVAFPPTRPVDQLPGFDDCDGAVDVDWLSADPTAATLDPGGTVTVRVRLDSSVLLQPGSYAAGLVAGENTPYPAPRVGVTFHVTPPPSWGRLTGLVQGVNCDGTRAPLPGVTVQINGQGGDWTLLTGSDGRYSYWIDRRANPLTLIVAKDGYQLEVVTVRVRARETVTADFDLTRATC
jgi:Carboxypeptidase regulatory-like domain